MKTKNKAWALLIPKGASTNTSRNVFVLKQQLDQWTNLKKSHDGNYYLTSILRGIYSLNALAGGRKHSSSSVQLEGASIHYSLNTEGDVLIHGLKIDRSIGPESKEQGTGIYPVNYLHDREQWKTSDRHELSMELNHKWEGTHFAAVSGKFDTKESAGATLIEHLRKAYRLPQGLTHKRGNHFSLYWQNGKHNNDSQRDHLVSLVQQAQSKKAAVSWLVHGEGSRTFVRAMEILANHPSLSRFEAANEEIVRNLRAINQKQRVFFSNPRGKDTNEQNLKNMCKKVGFEYIDTNLNQYDMRNEDARKKALIWAGITTGTLAVTGPSSFYGIENILKSLDMASNHNGFVEIAGLILAGGAICAGTCKLVTGQGRSLAKAWGSNFGTANQKWAS